MSAGALEDKACIVTGGARGIGRAVVERFIAEGARGVVAVDRSADELEQLATAFPGRIVPVIGDVRDHETHSRAVAAGREAFGGVDVLVGNAGVFDFRKKLESYEPDQLVAAMDELFSINVRGYLLAVRCAALELRRSKGAVVLTGSVASCVAGGGGVLYTGAKHAVIGIARQMAQELAPDVRVNVVAPGGTDTRLGGTQALGHDERALNARDGFRERIASHVPLGFAQTPEDHAGAFVFFASRRLSPAITGCVLMSDGGVGVRPL